MSDGLPMMPWYPRDFIASTLGWRLLERALYQCLLGAQWELGSLPDDHEELARIAGATPSEFESAWPRVKGKFPSGDDGRLRNQKLEQHRSLALERRDKKRAAGKAGGQASAQARSKQPSSSASTSASANGQAKSNPPSPSPSIKKEDSRRGDESPREYIWRVGVDLLTAAGEKDRSARSYLGKLCKQFGDDQVREAVGRAAAVVPAEPKAWLSGALKKSSGLPDDGVYL